MRSTGLGRRSVSIERWHDQVHFASADNQLARQTAPPQELGGRRGGTVALDRDVEVGAGRDDEGALPPNSQATPVVAPPRPTPRPALVLTPDGIRLTRIRDTGTVVVRTIRFQVSRTLAGSIAYIVGAEQTVQVFDEAGTLIIEHAWPAPGTKYVGSGKRPGRRATH